MLLRRELLTAGWNDDLIRRELRAGRWVKLRHGAYVDAAAWTSLDAGGRHGLRARAVLAQARTDVVLSHVSGLPEYDAPEWGIDYGDVHVTRLDGRAGRREAGVRQHAGVVRVGDVVCRNGVPVMNATRLALEVGTMTGLEASLCVLNHFLHHGHTDLAALRERAATMERWPGSLSTDLLLRLADPRIESVGETLTFCLCYRQGLPAPVPQHVVRLPDGTVVARLDFAWPDRRVWLEFDGRQKYEKALRPGERVSDVVIREKQREDLVRRLTGWRCVRLSWADLDRPERTAALIRDAFAASAHAA